MFNDQPSTTERPEAESARPRLRTRALALPLLVVAGIASVTACSKKEMAPEAVSRPADGSALGGPLAQA
jgi:hypothetical protein